MDKTDLIEVPVADDGSFRLTGAGKKIGTDPEYTHMVRTIDSWEIILVERGRLYMREGRKRYDVGPGGVLLLQPGREHGGYAPHDVDFFWLHFTVSSFTRREPEFLRLLAEQPGVVPRSGRLCIPKVYRYRTPQPLYAAFSAYLKTQSEEQVYKHERLLARFREIVFAMVDGLAVPQVPAPRAGSGPAHYVWRIMQLLSQHYVEDLSIESVAVRAGLNRDYANRIFKAANGCGIKEYLIHLRMDKARELLDNETLGVGEIAQQVGYDDPYYFSRLFKRKMGMSPRAYRELMYKVRN